MTESAADLWNRGLARLKKEFMMSKDKNLYMRVRNCLQTILDLREELDDKYIGAAFTPELDTLNNILEHLEECVASEADVERIEGATNRFLRELSEVLQKLPASKERAATRLQ